MTGNDEGPIIDESLHRQLGITLFNQTWDLIDTPARTADEDVAMLLAAAASRFHWGQAGGPEQWATGDWQVSHVAALMGLGDLALLFARRNLRYAEESGAQGWRLASAHEGMARAFAAVADWSQRDQHASLATLALADEPDEDDRQVIQAQLDSVPTGPSPT